MEKKEKKPRRVLSKEEKGKVKAYITRNYLTNTATDMGIKLGFGKFGYGIVNYYLKELGLKIPVEVVRAAIGKKMSEQRKGKSRKEWMTPEGWAKTYKFKKPPKISAPGTVVVRTTTTGGKKYKYKFVRLEKPDPKGELWGLEHRVKWEAKYGPIPEGHLLVFKTPDTLNTDFDNLELKTYKEKMQLNNAAIDLTDNYMAWLIGRHAEEIRDEVRKDPELIQLKRLQILLQRSIKRQIKKLSND